MAARIVLLLLLSSVPLRAAAETVLVFAAASLMGALEEAAAPWEARTGHEMRVSHAGSAALARQIERGAPADVFVSASVAWMDALEEAGLLAPGSRRDLLANRLVLVAHGEAAPTGIGEALAALGEGRLAMAMVEAVPAGIYGREALGSLGLWNDVAPRVAQAENVRAALALVARGEAPLGIVYATDAAAEDGVSVVATFPEGSHGPILYPAALTAGAGEAAASLLDHLASAEAGEVFARHGFLPPA
jgi:molybdate transport system substrate-binding protein